MMSELMFGAIPLAQHQTTKIHSVKDTEILITKLFSFRPDSPPTMIKQSSEPSLLDHDKEVKTTSTSWTSFDVRACYYSKLILLF